MSNSLVRKSLEILNYEKDLKQGKKKKERSKSTLDLIPAKHRTVSRRKADTTAVLRRSSKITVHEAKKQLCSKTDPIEENVQRLLLLSSGHLDTETFDKHINRAVKQYVPKKEKPAVPETTAFTEEDFKKFEQEYIG
ncbi:active regulator of SIRT1 [Orussus abietinus]|uniref:active regulator of SIRT1 n=1 Tax=Orussus abietinus TaxID=222816 RepID=UPI000626D0C0|nr:active regulator of SIRT1 [Orussus abietinus]